MCTEHRVERSGGAPALRTGLRATRRRFLAGGLGALAGSIGGGLLLGGHASATDGSADEDSGATGAGEGAAAERIGGPRLPTYRNRPSWGADESLRLEPDGTLNYPVAFYPVQKITVHHTASWTPWSEPDAVELLHAVYAEHIAQDFGDIGYHLLIDPLGTVYEGRYSGGTSFPIYDNYPSEPRWAPHAVNAAHTFQYNAGNIGISIMGDYDAHDITEEAWSALKTTIALICANTGLDPLGESRYHNPINGVEAVLPNVLPHRTVAGTDCPGEYIVGWFDQLRDEVAALVPLLGTATWLA